MKILTKIKNGIDLLKQIWNLPKINLNFINYINNPNIEETYRSFTKKHPKYLFFANKSVGVALIALSKYSNSEQYKKFINGKNSAAYYARKANKLGYIVSEINRNEFINDIYEINTSSQFRQGRQMSHGYREKVENYESKPHFIYFGVVDRCGVLRAYCNVGFYGDFAVVSQLLGHKDYLNDGVMYLMLVEIVSDLIDEGKINFLMYDTFFGASDGLKKFKQKLAFVPYRVKWVYND